MEDQYYSQGKGGQNGNNSNFSWDFREVGTSRFDWSHAFNEETRTTTTATTTAHDIIFSHLGVDNAHNHQNYYQHPSLLYTSGSHLHPDPHLTCLKLGKRHYFEDSSSGGGGPMFGERHVAGFPIGKRGRSYGGGSGPSSSEIGSTVVMPRCQVEGCHVALVNAKDYHRRHKVCEMHSKAPKVVVLGMEQRFCQQCSRFHVVSEFDDSKRSCRRRLAGHNERRRKGSNDSISRNLSQDNRSMEGRFPYSMGRALSLLSSKTTSWVSPSDLSSRSSAALRELIAENRAAILARQLFYDQGWQHTAMEDLGTTQYQVFAEPSDWDRFHEANAQVTLDLMQAPSSLQVSFREDEVQARGRSVL